jgi:hypothetical protein
MASALKFGTILRNLLADTWGAAWNSGTFLIYDAVPPANPQATYVGNLLATIPIPSTAFGAAADGVIQKNGIWSVVISLGGTAAGYRMISSDTTKVSDGTVGLAADNPDAVLDVLVLVAGGKVKVDSFSYTQPE